MITSAKRIACVIPARLQSSRFPRKMLASLLDKPILEWVWTAACKIKRFDDVVFAIDSDETAELIASFGGRFIMTDPRCVSGTARIIEVMQSGKVTADIWVNWQGDEPFITAAMIDDLLQSCHNEEEGMWTLKKLIEKEENIFAPNIAKVVCDARGFAMYFSRSPIPFFRDEKNLDLILKKRVYYKHVGIYAFTTATLQKIATLGFSSLEDAEKLEQLNFLENNIPIRIHETQQEVIGIDTTDDLRRAEAYAATLGLNPGL